MHQRQRSHHHQFRLFSLYFDYVLWLKKKKKTVFANMGPGRQACLLHQIKMYSCVQSNKEKNDDKDALNRRLINVLQSSFRWGNALYKRFCRAVCNRIPFLFFCFICRLSLLNPHDNTVTIKNDVQTKTEWKKKIDLVNLNTFGSNDQIEHNVWQNETMYLDMLTET